MANPTPSFDPRGIGHVYYDYMKKFSQKKAQLDTITQKGQTYGELLQRCVGAALGMEKYGLKPRDFISICSLNHLDVTVPFFASLFVGAATSAVDPTMAASEIVFLLNQTMPKMVFVEPKFVNLMEEVAQQLKTQPLIVVFGESQKYVSFSKFITSSKEEFKMRKPLDLDETTLVIFSSGTTGSPKGICHTHKSMLAAIDDPFVYGHSTIAWYSSPYWISFYTFLQSWIIDGMCRIVFSAFDSNNPWEAFNFKIDFLIMNTTQALTFLKHEKPDDVKADNVRCFLFGGNSVAVDQVLALRKKLPNVQVISGCGQSELFGSSFSIQFDSKYHNLPQKYPNCVGTIRSDILWKIVDIDTEEILGPNQQGELRVKAHYQCKGYHNRDSSETFDSEGWLKTGDLAYYNEDMAFFIVNRIKESFKYQHHHIIPSEIEHVLLGHPSIEKAVVFGVPHDLDTNHPMAVVQLKNNANDLSEEEIIKYVEERMLDKNRLRAGVKIVDKIPLTVTDKVNRFKLREMALHDKL